MKNELTLIILIPGFPINEEDSTCLPAQQSFIRTMNRDFPLVNLVILSFQYPFRRSSYYWNNNRVFAFAGRNRGGFQRWFLWQRIGRRLSRLKKENNIIGVLSFWAGECALVGKRWTKKNGIPHYAWLMGQDAKKENRYIKWMRPGGEELIAISDFTSTELQRNHRIIPRHIIPLGIDPQPLPADPAKRDIEILCVGSLIPLKQYHLCIDIMREITKKMPSAKLILCGKGPEENKIRSAILENDLSAIISLVGEKKHSEILALMKRARVFLHFSRYEGFGMVCLEARAAGTPVISFHQPMEDPVPGWYVVSSIEAMIEKTFSLLNSNPDHCSVYPYAMTDTTKKIMALFVS